MAVTCLLDDRPREFDDEDRSFLIIAGQRIGMEIARKRLEDERRASLAALRQSEPVESALGDVVTGLLRIVESMRDAVEDLEQAL